MPGLLRFAVLLSVALGAVGCYATTDELEELRQWSSDTATSTEPRPTVDDVDTLETVAPTDGPPHTGDRPTQDTGETIDSGWPTEDTEGDCAACPTNSGYPCPCDEPQGCADGALCILISENATMGVCLRSCEEDADCWRPDGCQAVGQCLLWTGEQMYCGYFCEQHWDCPANMSCDHSLGAGLCGGDS